MSNQSETVFADGFFVTDAREGAPEFVMGAVSISKDKAIAFINEHANEKGYVNLDLLRGKSGQPYLKLNTFTPQPKAEEAVDAPAVAEASSADLPF